MSLSIAFSYLWNRCPRSYKSIRKEFQIRTSDSLENLTPSPPPAHPLSPENLKGAGTWLSHTGFLVGLPQFWACIFSSSTVQTPDTSEDVSPQRTFRSWAVWPPAWLFSLCRGVEKEGTSPQGHCHLDRREESLHLWVKVLQEKTSPPLCLVFHDVHPQASG